METKDLIITPILLMVLIPLISFFRSSEKDPTNRSIFTYGIVAKFFGALMIGLIYQFYYGGGDTFNFFYHSTLIWEATLENPFNFLKFLFSSGEPISGLGKYIDRMYWYSDSASFFVAKVSAFLGLFTLHSFLPISLLFSLWSFSGSWASYKVFTHRYPNLKLEAAVAAIFIPSCLIWGSGLFKDTLTYGAIGWLIYGFYWVVIQRQYKLNHILVGLIGLYILYVVKIYILLSFIPSLIGWWVLENLQSIRSGVLKTFAAPFFFGLAGLLAFLTMDQMAESNAKYDIDNIAITSQTTAYDIAYWTGKGAGSTYYLGELDGTFAGMIGLAPQGIVVTLFRPWLWEVSNPFMLISAFESLIFLLLTALVLFRSRFFGIVGYIRKDPFLIFALVFSLVFAIGVGVSSFNFGSLSRYKIPLLPFYLFSILVLNSYLNYSKGSKTERSNLR